MSWNRSTNTSVRIWGLFALVLLATSVNAQNTGVGWWRFDEGTGQVINDSSGLRNNGILGSILSPDIYDPSWLEPGRLGPSALSFQMQQFADVPVNATLQPASVSVQAWVKSSGSPGMYGYIVSKGASGCISASFGLYTGASGGALFYIFDGTNYWLSPAVPPASVWNGNWHHLVGTYDGVAVRLYMDGTQVGTGTPSNGAKIAYNLSTSNDLVIGNYNISGCSLPFTGSVDDVRIWNTALSASVISTLATKACNWVTVGVSPASINEGGFVMVSGKIQSCLATSQPVTVDFATTTPCTKTLNLSIPIVVPPNFSEGVSFPLFVPKGSCTGAYSVSATTSINGFPVTMSSAALTVNP